MLNIIFVLVCSEIQCILFSFRFQCFLSKNEYGVVHNTIRKECNKLQNRMETIDYNEILAKLGFPKDWHKRTVKIKH